MDNPLTLDDTIKLFSYLDVHIQHSPSGCDYTLKHAKDFLQRYGDEFAATVIEWLESHGGFCDCEAIMNVLLDYLPKGDVPSEWQWTRSTGR